MQENHCALALPTNSIPVATLELQTAIVEAAHTAGLPTIGHAFSVDMTQILLQAGVDGLGHTFIDQPPTQEIIDLYKRNQAFVIPTLAIASSVTQELQEWREQFAEIAERKALVDDFTIEIMKKSVGMKAPTARLEYALDTIRKLKAEGIDILAGTDSAVGLHGTGIGPTLWMEMLLYIEKCDFSVIDALRSATAIPARRLGFDDRGVIAKGKRADLILIKGDLAESLKYLWDGDGIVGVWKEGIRGI
jgi:imidazolonepropionase-like amidohydrolase